MLITHGEYDEIQRRLDGLHEHGTDQWLASEPQGDLRDAATRDAWMAEREEFFEKEGPIPGPRHAREKLASLKGRYAGERIFVLGNGPSLNQTALHQLEDEFTFAVNRIYLMFERLCWQPTFYTTVDWRVAPDCFEEINALSGTQHFFPERFRGLLRDGDDVAWFCNQPSQHPHENGFATDASLGIRGAGSVTGAAIQLAWHMGFDPIYLIGCDVTYSIPGTVIQEGPDKFETGVSLYLTSTQDDDANHFDKRYFGAGKRWHDPNVKRMIQGFQQCQDAAVRHGRTIKNATVGGNLEVFPRVDFRDLFVEHSQKSPHPSPASVVVATAAATGEGLVVDIGTGSGDHMAPFAALGWEVRGYEPSVERRRQIRERIPAEWNVIIDPRAIDGSSGSRDAFTAMSGGISLAPMTDDSEPSALVDAAEPLVALEVYEDRTPDVLIVDATPWEMEVIRAWPFDTTRPRFVLVELGDAVTPRFGFDRMSLARHLESLGYAVAAFDGSTMVPLDAEADRLGGRIVLVAAGEGVLSDEVVATGLAAYRLLDNSLHVASRRGEPSAEVDPNLATIEELSEELRGLRSTTSWKLGSGIVQALAKIRRLVRVPGRIVRRALGRLRR
ncbi:MAG: DUF115 domain-containing protein [Acidimicrobiaceae bacterium]|nr:DUF115 domain-containing protein [Acidimicrobiaceae bacterium]